MAELRQIIQTRATTRTHTLTLTHLYTHTHVLNIKVHIERKKRRKKPNHLQSYTNPDTICRMHCRTMLYVNRNRNTKQNQLLQQRQQQQKQQLESKQLEIATEAETTINNNAILFCCNDGNKVKVFLLQFSTECATVASCAQRNNGKYLKRAPLKSCIPLDFKGIVGSQTKQSQKCATNLLKRLQDIFLKLKKKIE